jgi:hypothetical protein
MPVNHCYTESERQEMRSYCRFIYDRIKQHRLFEPVITNSPNTAIIEFGVYAGNGRITKIRMFDSKHPGLMSLRVPDSTKLLLDTILADAVKKQAKPPKMVLERGLLVSITPQNSFQPLTVGLQQESGCVRIPSMHW